MKKCKDHKGNEFNSIVEMCDYWHISPYCYYLRTKKLNWDIKKALATPSREKKTKTDNVCELLQRHGIIRRLKTFNKLLKDGYTIEQAIAEIKRHGKQILKRYRIGDEYGTAKELSEKYGIPVDKIYRLYGGKNGEKM